MHKVIIKLTFMAFALISCGKSLQDKGNVVVTRPSNSDPSAQVTEALKSQQLICQKGLSCPRYLAKVTVISKDSPTFCQGVLIQGNTILMSATCLPESLRVSGASCKDSLVFSFVTKNGQEMANFGCDRVQSVSSNLRRTTELWDNDIAAVKVDKVVDRPSARLSSIGISSNVRLLRWYLKSKTKDSATLAKDSCTRVTGSYANPFANLKNSSFQIFSSCTSDNYSLGSPMFNYAGRLVGIQSRSLSQKTITSLEQNDLLIEKTAQLNYISNLVCTDYRLGNSYPRPADCFERKTIYVLDRLRTDILEAKEVHRKNINEIEELSSVSQKYFKWRFKFTPNKRRSGYELKFARPECMFGIDDWIGEFRRRNSILTPGYRSVTKDQYMLKTKLNMFLQATSVIENLGPKVYDYKFNPYSALVDRESYIAVKADENDVRYKIRFENIKECN